MKRKLFKAIALLMALAMLAGLALSEGMLEAPDTGLDIEDTEGLEIGEAPAADVVEEMPEDMDLSLGALDLEAHVTYRFIVDDVEVATQAARAGEEILRPEAPKAPKGKAFAGWALADGTPLFVDADGDGKIDPVIVRDYELGTEVCVWAVFAEKGQEEEHVEAEAEAPTDAQAPSPDGEGGSAEALTDEVLPTETTTDAEAGEEPTSSDSADAEPASPEGEASGEAEEQSAVEASLEEQPTEESAEEEPAGEEPIAEAEEEPIDAQEPSPDGEGGSAEALTDEGVSPTETTTAEEAEEEPTDEHFASDAPVANALVYTGEAQALVSAGEGWLFSMDGEGYTPEIPTATDAGEYTVYFVPVDADSEAQTMTVTVAKADVVLIPPEAMTGEA